MASRCTPFAVACLTAAAGLWRQARFSNSPGSGNDHILAMLLRQTHGERQRWRMRDSLQFIRKAWSFSDSARGGKQESVPIVWYAAAPIFLDAESDWSMQPRRAWEHALQSFDTTKHQGKASSNCPALAALGYGFDQASAACHSLRRNTIRPLSNSSRSPKLPGLRPIDEERQPTRPGRSRVFPEECMSGSKDPRAACKPVSIPT